MRPCKEMPYHTGIIFRIYPSNEQKHTIDVNDGAGRFVYNRLVALNRERYRLSKYADLIPAYQERIDYIDSILRCPDKTLAQCLKNSAPFLYDKLVDSLAVENAVINYRQAWDNYFNIPGTGVPTFHKKGYCQSYQTNAQYPKDAKSINESNVKFLDKKHIQLPKLGRIRIAGSESRILELIDRPDTRIGTITIWKDAVGRYYVSLQISSENRFVENLNMTESSVGIDLNIENFLWDSNNNVIENPKFHKNMKTKLAKAQQSMARKSKQAKKDKRNLSDCKNYQKDRIRVAYLLSKIGARGDNFRHVVSKRYVENQDLIVAEDLKVKNLLKNHRLAFSISECGWSDFLDKLEYKAEMYGKEFIKVPPMYTTQTCSKCGYVMKGDQKLKLGDREWVCPNCGEYHIRDYNAAKNILAAGVAALSDEAPACQVGNAKISPVDDNSRRKALTTEPLSSAPARDKFGVSAKVVAVGTEGNSDVCTHKPVALATGS